MHIIAPVLLVVLFLTSFFAILKWRDDSVRLLLPLYTGIMFVNRMQCFGPVAHSSFQSLTVSCFFLRFFFFATFLFILNFKSEISAV